jgi:hypothetical protein
MQKALEVLKKEDGVTIKKLSHRKLLFLYKVPVYLGLDSYEPWDWVDLKVRYYQDKHEDGEHFCIIMPNKLYPTLSKKWAVKIKYIHTEENFALTYVLDTPMNQFSEIVINGYITGFRITDLSWIRNLKINKLLENGD